MPVDDPNHVMSACGIAVALGVAHAANPATFAFGRPLRLFRTPLTWLQAGCDGAVPLDLRRAACRLRDIDGPLAAEDPRHAADLRKAVIGSLRLDRIVIPRRRVAA